MKRVRKWPLAGLIAGAALATTFVAVTAVRADPPEPGNPRPLDVLHTPPALVAQNQAVNLEYGVACSLAEPAEGAPLEPCTPTGIVYARGVGGGNFTPFPLVLGPERRLTALLPPSFTSGAGFDYYVEMSDGRGNSLTVPPGGSTAPQHVWTVSSWTTINLGAHTFGQTRAPDATVVNAAWGKDPNQLGLNSGPDQTPVGPSAFDVGLDGSIIILDQVNLRIVVYTPAGSPSNHLPIKFEGGHGDLSVGNDGTLYVLDSRGDVANGTPAISSFTPIGTLIATTPLAEPVADMLRIGPSGPLVHGYPSEMWFSTGAGAPPLTIGQQIASATASRTVDSRAVVVHATPAEALLALVSGNQVLQAWRLTSTTSLGEVQLVEPKGADSLVAVVRVWTETQTEFRVLELTPAGLGQSFSVVPDEWAETTSLGRFRFRGGSLYQLRSDALGARVVRFTIGG